MFYFHPIRLKEPPIFNFPTLDSAKYFYKMAAIAGPSCGDMGLNSQNKNCRVSLKYITKYLNGEIGLCERQPFSSYTKKFEMIIGLKLDRVNRPLYYIYNT